MAIPIDPTAEYVNIVSNGKYASRTGVPAEFEALKNILMVYLNSNTKYFPEKKQVHALALLCCHYYALDDTQAPDSGGSDMEKGSVASETVGNVSISYGGMPAMGSVDGWKSYLAKTKYGSEFLYLMKTFRPSPLVVC